MSAAALAERLMKRAKTVPDAGFVTCDLSHKQQERKQVTPQTNDSNGKTAVCDLVTAVTVFSERVGKKGGESRPDQAANDAADAQAPAPADDWRRADASYMRHHFSCRTCCAAGHGRGDRCATGADLWASYEAACDADRITNTKARSAR